MELSDAIKIAKGKKDVQELNQYFSMNLSLIEIITLASEAVKTLSLIDTAKQRKIRISKDDFLEHFTIINKGKSGKRSEEDMTSYTNEVVESAVS